MKKKEKIKRNNNEIMRKSERKKEFDIFDTKLKFSFLVRPIDGPILYRKQIQTTTIQFQRDKKSLIR